MLLRHPPSLSPSLFSAEQGPGDVQLLPPDEQARRVHVDAVVRHAHLQRQERGGAEHHLRQLRAVGAAVRQRGDGPVPDGGGQGRRGRRRRRRGGRQGQHQAGL